MGGLKTLFEEHYVEIPEDKYDVLEGMVGRLDEMESKLNEQIDRNVQLNRRLSEAVSDTILNDVSEGLALTQKEKLSSLAESVEFESEEDYREKLETLKESYFTRTASFSSSEEAILVRPDSGVSSIGDLKGKKILTTANAGVNTFIPIVLANAGLKESDINLTNVPDGALVSSYLEGSGGAVGILGGLDDKPAEIKPEPCPIVTLAPYGW